MSQSPSESAALTDARGLRDYLSAWLAIGEMSRQGSSWSGRERHNVFLNSADGRFADVSAASGADYPDDGRSAALTDWDGDGDLDIWVASRTGPRIRFLRNRAADGTDYVALRLIGTTSNRDAIGARVNVVLSGARPALAQTLRAGEGFLAQSSKWMHFGLGVGTTVESVEVRWPGGERETFSGIRSGGHFELIEGSGAARALPARGALTLRPSQHETSIESGASRVRLTARPLLPPLEFETFSGESRRLPTGQGALLLNLWASWCAPCVTELRQLEASREELVDAGLTVVALSVDDHRDRALALLERVEPSFEVGLAPATALDLLDILQKSLLEERRRLALPMSFLIDPRGRLAVIYRGALRLEDLREDLGILELDDFAIRASTAPLPGRWATVPTPFPHHKLAGEFDSFGHAEIASLYRRLAARPIVGPPTDDPVAVDLARAFASLEQGSRREAESLFGSLIERLAAQLQEHPEDITSRNRLGLVLLGMNRPGVALQAFEQVLDRAPVDVTALTNAAILSWRGGHRARAEELVERLAEVDPTTAIEIRRLMAVER